MCGGSFLNGIYNNTLILLVYSLVLKLLFYLQRRFKIKENDEQKKKNLMILID